MLAPSGPVVEVAFRLVLVIPKAPWVLKVILLIPFTFVSQCLSRMLDVPKPTYLAAPLLLECKFTPVESISYDLVLNCSFFGHKPLDCAVDSN